MEYESKPYSNNLIDLKRKTKENFSNCEEEEIILICKNKQQNTKNDVLSIFSVCYVSF